MLTLLLSMLPLLLLYAVFAVCCCVWGYCCCRHLLSLATLCINVTVRLTVLWSPLKCLDCKTFNKAILLLLLQHSAAAVLSFQRCITVFCMSYDSLTCFTALSSAFELVMQEPIYWYSRHEEWCVRVWLVGESKWGSKQSLFQRPLLTSSAYPLTF